MKIKQLKRGIALLIVIASLLALCACKKPEPVSTDEAYEQLKTAAMTTVETNELYITIQGNVTYTTTEESSEENTNQTTTETSTIDIVFQIKTDENNKITERCVWIKLLDEDGSGLILEGYYKDGNQYSYSNFISETYTYTENAEADTFEPATEDTEELNALLDKALAKLPAPEATVLKDQYTLVWTVTNENLKQYIEAFLCIEDENLTDDEIAQKANELAENVTLENELKLTVKIKDGTLTYASADFDITLNNASYKGNVTFEMSLKNVTVTYPEERLEEIKEKSEQQ